MRALAGACDAATCMCIGEEVRNDVIGRERRANVLAANGSLALNGGCFAVIKAGFL